MGALVQPKGTQGIQLFLLSDAMPVASLRTSGISAACHSPRMFEQVFKNIARFLSEPARLRPAGSACEEFP